MKYLAWDGYRQPSLGLYKGGGTFVAYGRLCNNGRYSVDDPLVSIYFIAGFGYQYTT